VTARGDAPPERGADLIPPDLRADLVERELVRVGAALGRPLTVVALTASTNDDARRAALAGAPHGATFLADAQTAGRGRGGHRWHSPPGENLYLSMVLRLAVSPVAVAPVTLVVGVAVARAIERRCSTPARLKWPNDVQIDGKKIAGVLVEGQIRGDHLQSLIVGVGVNVRTERFPDDFAAHATSLRALASPDLDRASLAAEVIGGVGGATDLFVRSGLGPFLDELSRRDALLGRPVEVGSARGVGAGIDPEGRLLVRGEDGVIQRVVSGEVRAEG
jgi:BirA family biotin operon repressor/biotin-[acetyl-CoA-carboxylase] ligase